MKLSHLLIAFVFATSTAFAAAPVVVNTTGDSKVGRAGAFKSAKAGTEISEQDFLMLPAGSKATVKLADGSIAEFEGKMMVPGRRLVSAKDAGALVKLGQSLQKAAEAVVGADTVATVPGSGKADDKLGKPKAKSLFMSDLVEDKTTTPAFLAEDSLHKNDRFLARKRAEDILADAKADALERRRASLVLAQVYAGEEDVTKSLGMFARALESAKDENNAGKGVRASALVHRAQLHRSLGDYAKAKADLSEAIATFGDKDKERPLAWFRAHFILGTIALEEGDAERAKNAFGKIPMPEDRDVGANFDSLRELKKSADELVAQAQI